MTSNTYAAVYVRVSSEAQAEGASPDEQERDCRAVAAQHGLTVLKIYRDVERYRVKGKMVDPSGTRADRPGLVSMLADAAAGQFGTIIAWREDRLYRGMRAMLNVLETIQEHKVNIILARETFDAKIAPLKAWVAGMELEGMKERMTMGVKARLRAGKPNTGFDRYGYKRVGDKIVIIEEEARWVRQIFAWYIERVTVLEIRRRLIAAGAPQKGAPTPAKLPWSRGAIQGILKGAEAYVTGIKIQTRWGEAFEIMCEPIIDAGTFAHYRELRQANKTYPARNQKHDYLIGGLLYCACGRKWSSSTNGRRTDRHGALIEPKTPTGFYTCTQPHAEQRSPACPKTIGAKKADAQVWVKVVEAIDKPDVLLTGARVHVAELQRKAESILADAQRTQAQLDALSEQRQTVIRFARLGVITGDDLSHQLAELDLNELHARRELAESQMIVDVAALGQWEHTARQFLDDVRAGIAEINLTPQTDDERREVFELKRWVVQRMVDRVDIDRDRHLAVTLRLDVLALARANDQIKLRATRCVL